jgi:two-component system sensor histidine kinase YesM
MEISNRESELKLLQSQINPHFLYNTLDMIRWTARLEHAMETSKLIEQLSKMFRISLNRGNHWISLKDELTYSQIYLELQKGRLGNHLTFTFYCDHEVLNAKVLKQIIQPLIENSIHHGFENFRTSRHIYIRCFREASQVIIDVIDNGKGFQSQDFQAYIRNGYALSNIQDRLYLAFRDEAQISIIPKDSPGAWVRVMIPYQENGLDKKV